MEKDLTSNDLAKDFNLSIELNDLFHFILFYLFEHGHSLYISLCGSGTLGVVVCTWNY